MAKAACTVSLELNDIISPIGEDAPCGVDIRNDPQHRDIYYKVKDARNLARSIERNVAPREPLRLAQEWHDVNDLGVQILTSISKDIEVLAWLAEAQIRINGYAGLRDVFYASESLVKRHWKDIHSISDGAVEDKMAPLAGLNGVSGEGTLIQAIRLAPLVPSAGFAHHTLWDYQLAQRSGEEERWGMLHDAAAEAGGTAMAAHLASLTECIDIFDTLVATLDALCGELAPPSANTRNTLLEAAAAIRALAGLDEEASLSPLPPMEGNESGLASGDDSILLPQRTSHATAIGSREEAFMILLSVARYFRGAEPHSPLSLALETLVRRGRMNFSELLAELLPEPQARKAVLAAAGIQPQADDKENSAHG
ncbi:type VI secretion system protein TssA [Phyllobacterium phragmitis]|uniref:Type VI secretion system protein TssA n=1 Tax=Phyllobacterium phragmitis TaxID=2670329 RepID=A0A2S9IKX3_9HYPH|nr:type VI secretion system protein TssA [Phyllobacterium phragmitis]PRD41155.1 type VI secretion system protein TssA [Phyllobacterium phragmitis]